MSDATLFNKHKLTVWIFFGIIVYSNYYLTPPYIGYLLAYLLLLSLFAPDLARQNKILFSKLSIAGFFFISAYLLVITFIQQPSASDVGRDIGVFLSFFIGYKVLPSVIKIDHRIDALRSLGAFGWLICALTIFGAFEAFRAGASSYLWRAQYIPFTHVWLPYFFIINMALAFSKPDRSKSHIACAFFCVLASVFSLSRTDIVLYGIIFLAYMLTRQRVRNRRRFGQLAYIAVFILALSGVLSYFSDLDVVQERILLTVSGDDSSLGWRELENLSLIELFSDSSMLVNLTGFGLGARMPLPIGTVDFVGNNSIPHLHNSFATIYLKFGAIGLVSFLIFLISRFFSLFKAQHSPDFMWRKLGAGIVILVLGKAVTLQGLTEWSHVIFFGIGVFLIKKGEPFVRSNKSPLDVQSSVSINE